MIIAYGLLMYYGSALIPLVYLWATRFAGRRRRALLYALAFHLVASLAVIALMDWSRGAGYREWYWGMAYNIPVNIIFAILYSVILCRRFGPSHAQKHKTRVE
jgi:hypothetical protein